MHPFVTVGRGRRTPSLEHLRRARLFLKVTALAVTVAFLGLALQPLAIAANAPPNAAPAHKPAPASNEEKLASTLDDIEDRLGRLETRLTRKEDAKKEKGELKALRQDLDTLDRQALADFDKIGKHLKDKNLPQVIRDRHVEAVNTYKTEMATLKANLDAINQAPSDTDRALKAKKAVEHIKAKQKKHTHTPFDPKRTQKHQFKKRTPRPKAQEFAELTPPVKLAFAGSFTGLLLNQAVSASPTPDDLAETPEAQFTPDIQRLVTLFENDPIALYEFVRNNFTYEPYYGSVKGSQSTLLLQSGNDFDQASVLIALYRAAGIPARYVYGTVEIPIEKAMKWLGGITNPKVVGEALLSNGIPTKLIVSGGTYKAVQLEHVWVEAYLPYENYRGRINDPNAKRSWIPLDPSFKLIDPNPNAVDLAAAQNFDADAFFNQYLQSPQPDTPAKEYLRRSIDYVNNTLPGQRIYDLLSSGPVQEKVLELLPNTLPYPTKVLGSRFSRVPDNLRHRVSFELGQINTIEFWPALQYTATWTSLLHKRVTLSYEPATAADAQTVATYGNLYDTPPYLIYVKPALKLEGQTVAEGSAVPMAADLTFRMTFTAANGEYQGTVNNTITAGATHAIALDSGYTNGRVVTDRASKWEASVANNEAGDSIIGEFLNLFAVTYLQELDSASKITARTMKLLDTNHQAEVMVGVDLVIGYFFGIPRSLTIGGVLIDVDRNISTILSLDGDHGKARRFVVLSGLTGSALEHEVFEKVLSEPGLPVEAVSAVKALQVASAQGVPVHRIDQTNLAAILPQLQLDPRVISDIESAVAAGMSAVVSQTNITLNQWRGTGYILLNPTTGEGYYRISGGLSGGSLTQFIKALEDLIKHRRSMTADEVKKLITEHREKIWFPAPVNAEVGDGYGERTIDGKKQFHEGIDFLVVVGEPVYAVAKGTVTRSEENPSWGNVVYINHGFGIETIYAHLSKRRVDVGDEVNAWQVIGESGNTGNVRPKPSKDKPNAGQHLHFELHFDGKHENPESFFHMRLWL